MESYLAIINSHGILLYQRGKKDFLDEKALALLCVIHTSAQLQSFHISTIHTKNNLIGYHGIYDDDGLVLILVIITKNCERFQSEKTKLSLHFCLQFIHLLLGKPGFDKCHQQNIESYKRSLQICSKFFDYLLTYPIDILFLQQRFQVDLNTSQNQELLNIILDSVTFNENGHLPCALYVDGALSLASEHWYKDLDLNDLKLIQIIVCLSNDSSACDFPIYLKGGSQPVRIIILKLYEDLQLTMLCGEYPKLEQVKEHLLKQRQNMISAEKNLTLLISPNSGAGGKNNNIVAIETANSNALAAVQAAGSNSTSSSRTPSSNNANRNTGSISARKSQTSGGVMRSGAGSTVVGDGTSTGHSSISRSLVEWKKNPLQLDILVFLFVKKNFFVYWTNPNYQQRNKEKQHVQIMVAEKLLKDFIVFVENTKQSECYMRKDNLRLYYLKDRNEIYCVNPTEIDPKEVLTGMAKVL